MDDKTKKELQSATLDRLISHLRERKDVQNIDLIRSRKFHIMFIYKILWMIKQKKNYSLQLLID